MFASSSIVLRQSRRRPLAACVAAMFALSAPAAIANTVTVTSCNDVGPNTLRAAIASPDTHSGDTINMPGLMCSTITLQDFQIIIPQQDLKIVGPAAGVTIAHDGNYDRVFNHQGTGDLQLENLNITGGDPYSTTHSVSGGCIYSKGDVYLKNSSVTNCFADTSENYSALGGGIYTVGLLTLVHSTLAGNVAGHVAGIQQPNFLGVGGGAYVRGFFTAIDSSIRGNAVRGSAIPNAGGVRAYGGVLISSSTISGNTAESYAGLFAYGTGGTATIENSTISGNSATNAVGGVFSNIPTTVRNSTIAFNTAAHGKVNGMYAAPGLATVAPGINNIDVDLESSILSNNTYASNGTTIESDFSLRNVSTGRVTVTGNRNLILASPVSFASGVVAVSDCPLLGPLRDNGGPTQTHALLSHSPAIDAGGNPPQALTFDQRGSPYKRSDGPSINFTDIGAYELQQEDVVFNTSFESCPTL